MEKWKIRCTVTSRPFSPQQQCWARGSLARPSSRSERPVGTALGTPSAPTVRGTATVAWLAWARRRTRCPEEGGASTMGAVAARLTRWRQRGLTKSAGPRRGERKAVAHRCSEAAVGSGGQEGWRRGPATVGGDIGGEGPPGRGERSARVEVTVEGENGSGLKYGEGWRHDHGSALLNCATGGRGKGAGVRGQCPCGGGRRKERGGGGWCGSWRLGATGNGPRPSGVGVIVPRG
jgi:hypothetical protein